MLTPNALQRKPDTEVWRIRHMIERLLDIPALNTPQAQQARLEYAYACAEMARRIPQPWDNRPTPMVVTPALLQIIKDLQDRAVRNPVDLRRLSEQAEMPNGLRRHIEQMTRQSMILPFGWMVTFSIETGHPGGTARHLSLSSPHALFGKTATPQATWMIAQAFGFIGGLDACYIYLETMEHGGKAVNLVQTISVQQPTTRLQ